MRFPESWLREWVDPDLDTGALAERLTLLGLEVDRVEPAAPSFAGVVVGRIVEVKPHPGADRLRLCRVEDGSGDARTVVCGAGNARAGLYAPFARVGAVLPDGTEVERAEVRGVVSEGMLCSRAELGVGDGSDGLWELDAEAAPGTDLRAHAGLDTSVIELELTPNRGDCLSLRGLGRELAVATGIAFAPAPPQPVAASSDARFAVELAAPADCPRYAGRVIRGVDPRAPTPAWLARRLEQCGVRPIAPLVDVTNFVMLELGQPMHAFDLGCLDGDIEVRRARTGESLHLLDGGTVTLDPETLVIADARAPVALAGIMGGAATAVSATTADVFLESACFLPHALAGRARRYGADTGSSHRFERGVDPELAPVAIERATALIQAICGGRAGPAEDTCDPERLPARPTIRLRSARLERLLGFMPEPREVQAILAGLGLDVAAVADGWQARVPSWRYDLGIEADLVEEVARVHGYNRAPRTHPRTAARIAPRPERRRDPVELRAALVERGYHEAVTYSFVDPSVQAAIDPAIEPLALANPIAADMSVMRTTLWPGLLATIAHNRNRQQERVRLFEIGARFRPDGTGGLDQGLAVAGAAIGAQWAEQWGADTRPVDLFDVKGDVEALLRPAGAGHFRFTAGDHPGLHPGQCARIERDGEEVGWLGTLHPRIQRRLDLAQAPVLFELRLDALLRRALPSFEPVSRYPAIRRDLAVIVDESVPVRDLVEAARAAGPDELREVFVFDVYRGTGIDSGRKSIALGLILQGLSRTLTDAEVDEASRAVIASLRSIHGATLRE